ncbi:RecD superfamily protein [Rickettsiales endosymbiont of Paramecium tredecaurelia]|uniref:SF1B family DNA helicase RecD2 n=1 Tax=Candidatus Sarmatiella mevalonica TaxID=2770581 RepID=UPI001923265E|nr:RecD superfamily protein [Candidatus Sarmatiella mevalonica]
MTLGLGDSISGTIERIVFQNSDNGFAILKILVKKQEVTLVAKVDSIHVGEYVTATGYWKIDAKYGRQFCAHQITSQIPLELHAIEKYLSSGLIKGIGRVFAKKLVEVFGANIFDIIENNIQAISQIQGIGPSRVENISKAWQEQKEIRNIMLFLRQYDIQTTKAGRIYKTYGENAIEVIKSDPYRLAQDIHGIGFVSADKIAEKLGIAADSLVRTKAAMNYALLEASTQGHCCLPLPILYKEVEKLLGNITHERLQEALDVGCNGGDLILDEVEGAEAIFLPQYFRYEQYIAHRIKDLACKKPRWDSELLMQIAREAGDCALSDTQKCALEQIIKSRISIVTGGPGTGKTTLIRTVIEVLRKAAVCVKLCAPTGRAARRMQEATECEAVTIHRLIGLGSFQKQDIKGDCLVIDEMSMVDTKLFYLLLKSCPNLAIIMVGDVDQLPSVGPGKVLEHLIESDVVCSIKLTEVFRQSKKSKIVTSAHLINQAKMPLLNNEPDSDFYFIHKSSEEVGALISHLVSTHIPSRKGFDAIRDVQVLCPMQKGESGVRNMNHLLQNKLNPNAAHSGIMSYGQIFAKNDKVMQIENNYNKDVYNGDIGFIQLIDQNNHTISIEFDERIVNYEYSELDQLTLAYAVTIHKSQGSEYPVVIIPMVMQHYVMLQKNLLYTGVTRGKKMVVVVGEKRALKLCVTNVKQNKRFSKLKEFLLS